MFYLLKLLAIEEVAEELLDTGNTSGATDENDLVNLALRKSRVLKDLLDRVQGTSKALGVEILETSTSDGGVEILSVEKRVDLNGGLGGVGQRTLGTFTSRSQATKGPSVTRQVLSGLLLEFLLEVLKEVGVKVLTTKVGVTSSSLDSENTALDVQQRHIESTTTQVINQHVTLLVRFSGTKTIGNRCSGRLVDDSQNIQARNGTSVLSSLALVVVEVSWHGNNSLLHLLSELGLRNFFHLPVVSTGDPYWGNCRFYLHKDHRRDFLGSKGLVFAEVFDFHNRVSSLVDDLEGPRLNILLHNRVFVASANETPIRIVRRAFFTLYRIMDLFLT